MVSNWFILVVYCLLVYGISNHIVYAHGPFHMYDKIHDITKRIHPQIEEGLSCFICFPTWLGIVFSVLNYFFVPTVTLTPCMIVLNNLAPWWVIMALDGFVASAIGWLMNTIQESLEKPNEIIETNE